MPGRYTAILPFGSERAEELSPFARDLRRVLTGAVLDRVTEPAGERSLEVGFTRGDAAGGILVLLEMFGTGNLTVAVDGKIVAVAHSRRWAHRVVRVGAEYARAPSRADPWELTAEAIEEILGRSRTDLTSTLGARLGLGGPLAEELVARMGVDGQAPANLEPGLRARALHAALATLRSEVGDRPTGFLYAREGALLDATPYSSARWKGVDGVLEETRGHFSEAARDYFRTVVPAAPDVAALQASSERKEMDRMLVQQRAAVEQLEVEVARLQAEAERILAHYPEVEAALTRAAASGATRATGRGLPRGPARPPASPSHAPGSGPGAVRGVEAAGDQTRRCPPRPPRDRDAGEPPLHRGGRRRRADPGPGGSAEEAVLVRKVPMVPELRGGDRDRPDGTPRRTTSSSGGT